VRLVPTSDEERELVRQVKAAAALEGQTITTFVDELLHQAVDTAGVSPRRPHPAPSSPASLLAPPSTSQPTRRSRLITSEPKASHPAQRGEFAGRASQDRSGAAADSEPLRLSARWVKT
jgi:hypothetical protein